MIVLDTNILSELMRPHPAEQVRSWLNAQQTEDVFLTAVTSAEVLRGIARMPRGLRKDVIADKAEQLLDRIFGDRVLPFDAPAAAHFAVVAASREQQGRPIGMADAQIAAICRLHGADLATRNVKDFADTGIGVLDPWSAPAARDET